MLPLLAVLLAAGLAMICMVLAFLLLPLIAGWLSLVVLLAGLKLCMLPLLRVGLSMLPFELLLHCPGFVRLAQVARTAMSM
jgi:hypothetical protein